MYRRSHAKARPRRCADFTAYSLRRVSALATGKTRYFSRCKWGHEIRYKSGTCIGCQKKRIREKQKQQGQPSAMIDIEKLKDEMKLQALIGEGYEE